MSLKIHVKCLVAILVLVLSATAEAETPAVEWIRQLGTPDDDISRNVSVDDNSNIYITGCTQGGLDGNTSAGLFDIFLTKYDSNGTRLWTKQLGTASNERGLGISVEGNGNAYVTGWTAGGLNGNTNVGGYDMFLTKYNTNGNKQWTEQLGTILADVGSDVSVDGSGNAYVTGWTWGNVDDNTNVGNSDILLIKYDMNGTKLWTRQLGSPGRDYGCDVSVDGSGNAYVTGYTWSNLGGKTNEGFYDIFLTKYDTNGTKLWIEQMGTTSYDYGLSVSVDGGGNAYVTGYTDGGLDGNANAGSSDMFLIKYDTNGTKLWTEQLGTTSNDRGLGVSVDGNGNAYVAGETCGNLDGNAGKSDIFLIKYDTNGTKLWTEQLGTVNNDYGEGVTIDCNGNAYVTGETWDSLGSNINAGGTDIFLVKISTVPEPATLTLILAALLALGAFRCCR